jgi:NADH dehydrogenase (ubiquinone) 1 alpha subcomplex subunit 2
MALKKANPKLPILLREASGISAKCYARYDYGKEKNVTLDNLSANEVMTRLQALDLEGSEKTGKKSFAA